MIKIMTRGPGDERTLFNARLLSTDQIQKVPLQLPGKFQSSTLKVSARSTCDILEFTSMTEASGQVPYVYVKRSSDVSLLLSVSRVLIRFRTYCFLSPQVDKQRARESCSNILSSGPGQAITIVVGGAAESWSARPGTALHGGRSDARNGCLGIRRII
ncbi:uncharacterized protein F5147DRAFT_727765 [Suillus discolor]|uniref:Uncharacterized protein n=1 Tax=Suillus discolor TaxID=1912936 RepID=A0A9P7ESE0_9AGAM|nr:uncharacterized protein F5147DRAFT_727765 [Suillus discolor]KAG2087535.1 hypothetical protein F5147DRAFT_727765 [Suillus discolor]